MVFFPIVIEFEKLLLVKISIFCFPCATLIYQYFLFKFVKFYSKLVKFTHKWFMWVIFFFFKYSHHFFFTFGPTTSKPTQRLPYKICLNFSFTFPVLFLYLKLSLDWFISVPFFWNIFRTADESPNHWNVCTVESNSLLRSIQSTVRVQMADLLSKMW